MAGNRVSVDWNSRTVTISDKDGKVVQTYPFDASGHSTSVEFDPNDPQPIRPRNRTEPERDAEGLARLAVAAASPSEGARQELLGEAGVEAVPAGLAEGQLKETKRDGGVGEREVLVRSAVTGKFVTQAEAAGSPETTVTETKKKG